jgi:hypothetical protein
MSFFIVTLDGERLCLCGTVATNWPIVHLPDDTSEYEAVMEW